MTNEQLIDHGHQMMDETDEAIERSKKVCFFKRLSIVASITLQSCSIYFILFQIEDSEPFIFV